MSGSLHTRLPRTLGTEAAPRQHFREHESGGIRLNLPVYSSLPGQATVVRGTGISIAVGAASAEGDDFLTVNESGALNIRTA